MKGSNSMRHKTQRDEQGNVIPRIDTDIQAVIIPDSPALYSDAYWQAMIDFSRKTF